MLKNIDPADKSIKPFQAFKDFTLNNNDSGSGHIVLRAVSSSIHNFLTGSATSQSFGAYTGSTKEFANGTFYDIPNWFSIKHLYYENNEPYRTFGNNNLNKEKRELGNSARIFTIPRDLFGERVKPESVRLDVTTSGVTYSLRDDGDGNIYDFAHSASYAAYKSSSFDRTQGILANGSGSQVGNIFYEHGVLVLTDTGSLIHAGVNSAGEFGGHTLKYKATKTIYEYEYLVRAEPNEFNITKNISSTTDLSGSLTIAQGSKNIHQFFPPGDNPVGGSGSFSDFYNATHTYSNFVTHSEFRPYVTTIGLYNDKSELMVVGKLARPLKLSRDNETAFVVRFDI